MVKIETADGELREIPDEIASLSGTISDLREDVQEDETIPIPNVTSAVFDTIHQYCQSPTDGYFDDKPMADIFEMILAANYLDMKDILSAMCKHVANYLKGKSPEEIRQLFGLKNDFTPEEEEQVRKENEWCEER